MLALLWLIGVLGADVAQPLAFLPCIVGRAARHRILAARDAVVAEWTQLTVSAITQCVAEVVVPACRARDRLHSTPRTEVAERARRTLGWRRWRK